jgi:PAS domain S-box-containing protein
MLSGNKRAETLAPPITDAIHGSQALRRLAKEILQKEAAKKPQPSEPMSAEETTALVHKLRVHQIELEMQNEELRRAQFKLDASRARYFNLYNLAPVGYCTISEQGLILEANLTASNLLGVPRGELIKQPISRFILKEDQNSYYLLRKNLFAAGEQQTGELRMVRRDGTTFWAHLESTVALTDSGETVSRLMLSDVTNRKGAERALQESHRQNQEILDSITDAFISLTDGMVVNYFNSAAERMLRKKRSDVVGQKLFDVFPEAKGSIFEENYSLALRTKSAVSFETEFTVAPYQNWYDVRVYPSREGITIYFQVTTERKQAEEAKAKLESVKRQTQKAESLGRMAGAIAHHFNNKLQVVRGFLELSLDGLQPGDPSIYKLNKAINASDQAAEVSKMMLTYLGQTVEKQEPLNLSEICRMSIPQIQAAMPKNLVLETNLPSPEPVIEANVKQIQQILTNLVTNAWEAIGANNGSINLTVKIASLVEIATSHRFPVNWQPTDTPYACLEVQDNGCGIADKDLEEIFSPFFSTKFTGRGMGLPVVLGLVQVHRGVVTAESQPGQGSVFRVFLPISAEEIIEQRQKETNDPEPKELGMVLLVDDDRMVLELTSMMLLTLGFTVLRARDGIEAVEVFRQHIAEIRFVLSDVAMPHMNGWDTLLALRQIKPDVRVILASGYGKEQVMEGAHSELPQAFLGKPYGFQNLKAAIRQALAEIEEDNV